MHPWRWVRTTIPKNSLLHSARPIRHTRRVRTTGTDLRFLMGVEWHKQLVRDEIISVKTFFGAANERESFDLAHISICQPSFFLDVRRTSLIQCRGDSFPTGMLLF